MHILKVEKLNQRKDSKKKPRFQIETSENRARTQNVNESTHARRMGVTYALPKQAVFNGLKDRAFIGDFSNICVRDS